MTTIKTWQERCEEHPDHEGIVTERMIRCRMQEEIDELRQAIEQAETREWVGLNHFDRTLLRTTHAPLKQIYHDKNNSVCVEVVSDWDVFFDAVEAKLKEKNG
jgi:hypothetical protein